MTAGALRLLVQVGRPRVVASVFVAEWRAWRARLAKRGVVPVRGRATDADFVAFVRWLAPGVSGKHGRGGYIDDPFYQRCDYLRRLEGGRRH